MVSLFNFQDFRAFIKATWAEMPKEGYGQSRKLAEFLNVHTTLVSQIMHGDKSFSMEQAALACEFFSLSDLETDYFLILVQLDRAGSQPLRRALGRQIESLQKKAKNTHNRLIARGKLAEEHHAQFYSHWIYSTVRQLTAIDGLQTAEAIAAHLQLSNKRIKEVVEFLVSVGLVKQENGKLSIGPTSTHIERNSPWSRLHLLNWRTKALEVIGKNLPAQFQYSAPMTLSKADAEALQELIVKFLESVDKLVEPSPSESLHCLNIDWFEVTK